LGLTSRVADVIYLKWDLEVGISNKFPGYAAVYDLENTI
jgi:hypothetical protein